MISSLISEAVALGSNLTVIAIAALLAVALASQRGLLGDEVITWGGVAGVGFVAGRLTGPPLIDRVVDTVVSLVSGIPIVGDALVGVVA